MHYCCINPRTDWLAVSCVHVQSLCHVTFFALSYLLYLCNSHLMDAQAIVFSIILLLKIIEVCVCLCVRVRVRVHVCVRVCARVC